uniref:Uncharacterized protein n=1 Tax=Anguilla anguilla TaxID=7936 RepID=A0A0E9V490_ANGAN
MYLCCNHQQSSTSLKQFLKLILERLNLHRVVV